MVLRGLYCNLDLELMAPTLAQEVAAEEEEGISLGIRKYQKVLKSIDTRSIS